MSQLFKLLLVSREGRNGKDNECHFRIGDHIRTTIRQEGFLLGTDQREVQGHAITRTYSRTPHFLEKSVKFTAVCRMLASSRQHAATAHVAKIFV